MTHTLMVCALCRMPEIDSERSGSSQGQTLLDRLSSELAADDGQEAVHLQPVRCMGACSRSCVVAFTAPNKLTFIFSELSPARSVPELLQFSRQYAACATGNVPYKDRPNAMKQGLLAVLPPPSPQLLT